jgi:hypothetical protein
MLISAEDVAAGLRVRGGGPAAAPVTTTAAPVTTAAAADGRTVGPA